VSKSFIIDGHLVVIVMGSYAMRGDALDVTTFSSSWIERIPIPNQTVYVYAITEEGERIDGNFRIVSWRENEIPELQSID